MLGVIRWGGLAILAGGFLVLRPVAAQELSKDTQERQRVEAQRLEVMVSDALSRSEEIGQSDPMKAVRILREAKGQLAADTDGLKPERREALGRKIDLRIKAWDA